MKPGQLYFYFAMVVVFVFGMDEVRAQETAVGVRLGGPTVYGGVVTRKPYINEEGAPVEEVHVRRAMSIVIMTSLLGLGSAVLAVVLRAIL